MNAQKKEYGVSADNALAPKQLYKGECTMNEKLESKLELRRIAEVGLVYELWRSGNTSLAVAHHKHINNIVNAQMRIKYTS